VRPEDVNRLEAWIDEETSRLPPLRSFVLPDGVPGAAALHVARTVVRRAEREVVALIRQEEASSWNPATSAYLNRLSDLLFVWARGVNVRAAFPETLTSAQARGEPPA
jgi:cob(I)alamin adenosyltransferase